MASNSVSCSVSIYPSRLCMASNGVAAFPDVVDMHSDARHLALYMNLSPATCLELSSSGS